MAGRVDSLNVSAAGAVVLFEAARQRRATGPAESRTEKPQKMPKGLGS
jgi:23S rRNA (guanosine2251-2'-O)-methyltransferase